MKKFGKFLSILLVLAIILPGMAEAKPVSDETFVKRLEGERRVETAINVSNEAYDKADTVILAGYHGEVDALTGTIIAHSNKAPMLLTQSNKVSDGIKTELERLGAKKIIILGGKTVVSEEVMIELKKDYEVERVSGDNRAETAKAIAKEVKETSDHVFLALGYDNKLSDALAIGPVSAIKNDPVLLAQADKLPEATIVALKDLKVKETTLIGGEDAVNEDVVKELEDMDITVTRVFGDKRESTATAIAKKYLDKSNTAIVAYGWEYADALVGGYLGAKLQAPILLTNTKNLAPVTEQYIKDNICKVYVLGGTTVISESTFNEIKEAVDCEEPGGPVVPVSYNVSFELIPKDAKLVVKFNGTVVAAGTDGKYVLTAGEYSYEVSKEGYDTKKGDFEVVDKDLTINVNLELEAEPNLDAIKNVEDMIAALPEVKDITRNNINDVGNARDAFEALTTKEQALVTNKAKLMAILDAFELIENEDLAEIFVEIAEDTKDPEDIAAAQEAVDKLPEGTLKTSLQARLDAIMPVGKKTGLLLNPVNFQAKVIGNLNFF